MYIFILLLGFLKSHFTILRYSLCTNFISVTFQFHYVLAKILAKLELHLHQIDPWPCRLDHTYIIVELVR
jgi:hypothetical protein